MKQLKTPIREKLYESTKPKHEAVELAMDFKNGLTIGKLRLFLRSILYCRRSYQDGLLALEQAFSVNTLNNHVFLPALEEDAVRYNLEIDIPTPMPVNNQSFAIGVFYVFAGSAMGARVISKMAAEHNPPLQSAYLSALVKHSKQQLHELGHLLSLSELDETALINGANETFETLLTCKLGEPERKH